MNVMFIILDMEPCDIKSQVMENCQLVIRETLEIMKNTELINVEVKCDLSSQCIIVKEGIKLSLTCSTISYTNQDKVQTHNLASRLITAIVNLEDLANCVIEQLGLLIKRCRKIGIALTQ